MNALFTIAEHLIVTRLLSNHSPVSGQSKALAVLIGMAGVFLAVGTVFLLYALYLWLLNNYSPEIAALAVGGACMLLAFLSLGIVFAYYQYRRMKIRQFRQDMIELLKEVSAIAGEEVAEHVREQPTMAMAAAGAAGYMLREKFL